MAVLVIAEHNHAALNPAVYSLVTAAQKIGGDIDIMITAQDGGKLAKKPLRSMAFAVCCFLRLLTLPKSFLKIW